MKGITSGTRTLAATAEDGVYAAAALYHKGRSRKQEGRKKMPQKQKKQKLKPHLTSSVSARLICFSDLALFDLKLLLWLLNMSLFYDSCYKTASILIMHSVFRVREPPGLVSCCCFTGSAVILFLKCTFF